MDCRGIEELHRRICSPDQQRYFGAAEDDALGTPGNQFGNDAAEFLSGFS